MRKIYTLMMLFVSIGMSAQTLEGDVNKDGKLTIEDVTKVIDLYLNYEEPSGPDDKEQGSNLNGHEYVDLGLPSGIKWATCNVGAKSPEEYGDYFAWGETTPKSTYDWITYKWCNGSSSTMAKYCTSSSYGTVDNKTVLDPEDDAAHVNWGGDWRMPTYEEQTELRSKCTWSWTTMNGVYGRKVVGPNGNSIFLPAAGYRYDGYLNGAGSYGYYWSSSLNTSYSDYAYYLYFYSSTVGWDYYNRFGGLSVRPVCHGNGSKDVVAVTSIALSATTLSLTSNESQKLTATVIPANASNANIVWSSSNKSVATVENGTVVARDKGTAVITATAADGSGVKAECIVTVENKTNINGHEYVDLGLPSGLKWATCNVGATSPEEYGDYFAWGETTPKSEYSWNTYKWCKGSYDTQTKYCTSSSYGIVDNKTVLDPEDDAAHVNWGGDWRMPTYEEQTELRSKCTWSWTTMNGVYGRKVVGPNGNSIFLPAAGFRDDGSLFNAGSYGYYWSSSLYASGSLSACYLGFYSSNVGRSYYGRVFGQSVRAVCQ